MLLSQYRFYLLFSLVSILIASPQIHAARIIDLTDPANADAYISHTLNSAQLGHMGSIAVGDVNGDGIHDLICSSYAVNVNRPGSGDLPGNQDGWTESITRWSVSGNGSSPSVSIIRSTGNYSVSTTRTASGQVTLRRNFPQPFVFSAATDTLHFQVYADSSTELLQRVEILAPDNNNRFRYTFNPDLALTYASWNQIDLQLSQFSIAAGSPDWNNVRSLSVTFSGGGAGSVINIDHLYFHQHVNVTTENAGAIYIFYGGITGGNILAASSDVTIYGIDEYDYFGEYITSGDINNDGYDDVIIGAMSDDGPGNLRTDAGAVYVVFGSNTLPPAIDLKTRPADYIVYGADADDRLGMVVLASDINADGIQDIIAGAPRGKGFDNSSIAWIGEVHIILGSAGISGILDLNSGNANISIYGNPLNHRGIGQQSTIGIGDVYGDGQADIIIGVISGRRMGSSQAAGQVLIIDDISDYSGPVNLASLTPDTIIYGADDGDSLSAIAIGDVNGDNISDIIVGAPGADGLNNSKTDAGEVHIFFGSPSLPAVIDLRYTSSDATILGIDPGDSCGFDVFAKDFNNDGIHDILIAADLGDGKDNSKTDAGEAYVIYGSFGLSGIVDLSITSPDLIIYGADNDDHLRDVCGGDISGDGINDIIVGFRDADGVNNAYNLSGDIFVIYGETDSPDTTPPAVSATSPASGATGVAANVVITATFSEAMDPGSITTSTFLVNDGSANIGGTVSCSGATATFTPSVALAHSTAYTATVTTGVMDVAGNAMAADYTWSFITDVCGYSISPASQSFSSAGGTGNVSVTTGSTCAWTATSNASWVTITSGNSGTGNGTVSYSVAGNSGNSRTGTMTIAGQTFTVNQEAGGSVPAAPSNLRATSTSASNVNLAWNDNSADETGFEIYRRIGAGGWTLLATTGANVTGYSDASATGNTTTTSYSYYVQACNGAGCSAGTSAAVVPYRPTGLTARAVSSGRINLSWTDTSGNESDFQIQRRTGTCSSGDAWVTIATVAANTTSYSDTGLATKTRYAYRVRATTRSSSPYAYGYSMWSDCDSTRTR